ncbi:cytochrome P450 [Nocardia altamirensis]|uniref:cytochrome P450 n=1 Tax=Nocardia altamirensis TaxID=472158 RepID=UPI0008407B2A|nr:cytochrome P450 [Nocardia altamirensis]
MILPSNVPPHVVRDFDYHRDLHLSPDPARTPIQPYSDPIFWTPKSGGYWVLTRYTDISAVLRDTEHFSNATSPTLDGKGAWPRPLIPQELDPPEHGKYRRVFVRHLNRRTTERITTAITTRCTDRIAEFTPRGRCELMADLARPMQYALFTALYDASHETAVRCAESTTTLLHSRDTTARAEAGRALEEVLSELIAARPQHGFIGTMINSDDESLTDQEMLDMAAMLALASLDTLANSLGFAFKFLAEHPQHQHALATDPELATAAVEELLRLHSVANLLRTAVADRELCGMTIRSGDRILLSPTLAHHDPHAYDAPSAAHWDRPSRNQHLAFGIGAHRCVGVALARTALKSAITSFHAQIPSYRIPPEAEIKTTCGVTNEIRSLPLVWTHRLDKRSGGAGGGAVGPTEVLHEPADHD